MQQLDESEHFRFVSDCTQPTGAIMTAGDKTLRQRWKNEFARWPSRAERARQPDPD